MSDTRSTTELPEVLAAWIAMTAKARIVRADRVAGGGRKQAWRVDVERDNGSTEPLFFRWDPVDPTGTGDPWTVHREAKVYAALTGTGLPVAQLLGVHPTDQAMLATWIDGSAAFSTIPDAPTRSRVASAFMGHLAALHRLAPAAVGLIEAEDDRSCAEFVRAQIDEMKALIRFRGGEADPVLTVALRYLDDNVPSYDGPKVIVQGDTGPGNFLLDGDRVTAIVDWELAHVGDPMDDLAWVSLRSVQDPFPDLATRFGEYAAASGHQLDPVRIRYYRVMAEAKILTMNHGTSLRSRADAPGGGGDIGARLIFGQLHRRLCVEALADACGATLAPVDLTPPPPRSELDDLYDIVLAQLRDVIVPRIDDGFAVQRTKGMARVLKYLAAAGPRRATFDDLERHEIAALLGTTPASAVADARAELSAAIRAGRVDVDEALAVLHRAIARDNELLRDASGALADRHYDVLPS